jgi:hypothetical protein
MLFRKITIYIFTIFIVGCATNSTWMKDYSKSIDHKPISGITLPGSHLANAYNITANNPLCMGEAESASMSYNAKLQHHLLDQNQFDQDTFIKYLNTQDQNIKQQLNNGIRYFELQICKQQGVFYTSNVYLTNQLDVVTTQMKKFLENNPQEIVILNFDHLWAEYGSMNNQDAWALYAYLVKKFGNMLTPKSMQHDSIGDLKSDDKQVILLSKNTHLAYYDVVWDANQIMLTAPAEYSTIKKIRIVENAVSSGSNPYLLRAVPIYSVLSMDSYISNFADVSDEDFILFNYLGQTLNGRPVIIISDYKTSLATINLAIANNQHVN